MRARTLDFSETAAHAMAWPRDSYGSTRSMNPGFLKPHPGATPASVIAADYLRPCFSRAALISSLSRRKSSSERFLGRG